MRSVSWKISKKFGHVDLPSLWFFKFYSIKFETPKITMPPKWESWRLWDVHHPNCDLFPVQDHPYQKSMFFRGVRLNISMFFKLNSKTFHFIWISGTLGNTPAGHDKHSPVQCFLFFIEVWTSSMVYKNFLVRSSSPSASDFQI